MELLIRLQNELGTTGSYFLKVDWTVFINSCNKIVNLKSICDD